MPFLPDTNVWISLLKNRGGRLEGRFRAQATTDIRHQLEVQGSVIGPNDLMIAAIARAHGLTLVSADQGFRRVPGLTVEDWAQA
jgi:predicted nucleic acid-binding protein